MIFSKEYFHFNVLDIFTSFSNNCLWNVFPIIFFTIFSDLTRLYWLFSRVKDGVTGVALKLREHVRGLGLAIVEKKKQQVSAGSGVTSSSDGKEAATSSSAYTTNNIQSI